jgi:hypothetical protein
MLVVRGAEVDDVGVDGFQQAHVVGEAGDALCLGGSRQAPRIRVTHPTRVTSSISVSASRWMIETSPQPMIAAVVMETLLSSVVG